MTTVTRYPCSQQLRSLLSLISRLWSPVFCLPSPVSSFQSPSPSPVSCLLSPNSCLQSQSPVSCLHLLSPSPVSISCLHLLSPVFPLTSPVFHLPSPLFHYPLPPSSSGRVELWRLTARGDAGLGIRSSVLQANCSFFAQKSKRMSYLLKITSNSLIFGE